MLEGLRLSAGLETHRRPLEQTFDMLEGLHLLAWEHDSILPGVSKERGVWGSLCKLLPP